MFISRAFWWGAKAAAMTAAIAACLLGCQRAPSEASLTGEPVRADPKPQNVADAASTTAHAASTLANAASTPAHAASTVAHAVQVDPQGSSDAGLGDASAKKAVDPVGGSWVTCYGRYRPTSTPERDVTRLGLMCGPENGMKLVGPTLTADTGDTPFEHAFEAKAGECFRVFAVGEARISDLAVEVRDPAGAMVTSDHNGDRWPMLNPDGPFCLLEAGKYTVRVRARAGKGTFALQVWRLPT